MAENNTKNFSATRLQEGAPTYADGSDAYANNGFILSFFHIPSEKQVYFKAFITAYNETYSSDWASETVYGRGDPIHMFKNTRRNITLAFKVPAATESEAFENLSKVQSLLQFLYPGYTEIQSANTISQSPLVRLKVMNLLGSQVSGQGQGQGNLQRVVGGFTFEDVIKKQMPFYNGADLGALGVIKNITVQHHLEDQEGVLEVASGTILPKLIDINLEFEVIHEHPLGWQDKEFSTSTGRLFPYGIDMANSGPQAPTDVDADVTSMPHVPNPLTATERVSTLGEPSTPENISDEEIANAVAAMQGVTYEAFDDISGKEYAWQDNYATADGSNHAYDFRRTTSGEVQTRQRGSNGDWGTLEEGSTAYRAAIGAALDEIERDDLI
jgi:hypothetical protein